MQITWMPIDQVRPYENNPRKNKNTIEKLTQSLKEYGWQQPIVVDTEHSIIVGHARFQAAIKLGINSVPVHVARDLTPAQVQAYRLADNRVAEESGWDMDLLRDELTALRELEVDLSLTGFRETELSHFLKFEEPSFLDPDSMTPVSAEIVSQRGDVWVLGPHRVMCGDASLESDVAQLMGDKKANLIFTDPPYNVNYQGCPKHRHTSGKKRALQNDDLDDVSYYALITAALKNAALFSTTEASLYLCHACRYAPELELALSTAGFTMRCQIIWAKQHFVLNFSRYKTQHEPILYCHRTGHTDTWYGDNKQSTLWCFDKPNSSPVHPTTKPVDLILNALHNSSLAGDLVLDLFGGSGSTLIAANASQRSAYLMEIDPQYTDVIVRRWQLLTQGRAILAEDGRGFDELPFKRNSHG
jgi:DNA modification methylase